MSYVMQAIQEQLEEQLTERVEAPRDEAVIYSELRTHNRQYLDYLETIEEVRKRIVADELLIEYLTENRKIAEKRIEYVLKELDLPKRPAEDLAPPVVADEPIFEEPQPPVVEEPQFPIVKDDELPIFEEVPIVEETDLPEVEDEDE